VNQKIVLSFSTVRKPIAARSVCKPYALRTAAYRVLIWHNYGEITQNPWRSFVRWSQSAVES